MNERWASLTKAQRGWVVVGFVVVAVIVLDASLSAFGSKPGGPALSSYSTDVNGLAAYEALLVTSDHAATHARVPIDKARIAPASTLVALGQTLTASEKRALAAFVRDGGRAVVGGPEAQDALAAIGDGRVEWRRGGVRRAQVSVDAGDVGGARVVRGEGYGEWTSGSGVVLLRAGDHVTGLVVAFGAGELVALADPSPLTNHFLDVADNAAFGVGLVGAPGRQVVFAEYGHGYGVHEGLGGLPARWKAAMWFAAIAALVGALSAGKRFGPADPVPVDEAPPRVRYVEALASTLLRSRDRAGAVEPLRARATRLADRHNAIISDDDRAVLTAPITNDEDVLALGRVAAKLEER